MIIRDYLSCKDRTFLWKCSSLLKNLYLCPFEYEKLLIKNLIKEMKEQIQKKINDSKALRWGVLVLVAFTMLCGYFLTDVMSPLKKNYYGIALITASLQVLMVGLMFLLSC